MTCSVSKSFCVWNLKIFFIEQVNDKILSILDSFIDRIDDQKIYLFAEILDKYPVTPYLDSRDSFVRWTHFIHNKINSMLGKAEIPLIDLYKNHYKEYEPRNIAQVIQQKNREKIIFGAIIFISISGVVYYYNK